MFRNKWKKMLASTLLSTVPIFAHAAITDKDIKPLIPNVHKESISNYNEQDTLEFNYRVAPTDNYSAICAATTTLNSVHRVTHQPLDEKSFFTPEVQQVITPSIVEKRGVDLAELSQSIESHGVKAQVNYATLLTQEEFLTTAKQTLQNPNEMMIIQFDQSYTSMSTHTTYVALADIDTQESKVLIMHFSPDEKKYEWIKIDLLLKGMKALNNDHCPYGYMIVDGTPVDTANAS